MTADDAVALAEILLGEARNLLLTAATSSPVTSTERGWLMRVVYAIEEHCLDDLADWNVKGDL